MSVIDLNGKVAVVTGASQGLGEALAQRLDAEGCFVAVCDFNIEGAKAVAAKLKNAIAIPVDVTNYEQCEQMAKTVIDKWGKVDILVSNAGIVKSGDIYSLTPQAFAQDSAIFRIWASVGSTPSSRRLVGIPILL